MGILNPIASKFNIVQGTPVEVYMCPANKSHAIIDVSFFKNSLTSSSTVGIALTTQSNPANLTSLDYFVDDIDLVTSVNSAELNKVVVGRNERIFVVVMNGDSVNVRVSGMEENNAKVLAAGKLSAASISGTAQTQFYTNALANVAYISGSITIFNTQAVNAAEVEMWITSSASPGASDKVMRVSIPPQDTTIIESVQLLPQEKIFVKSSQANTEYFLNGVVVAV